jgi:peptidoglycan hydrolase CwlO-like protein
MEDLSKVIKELEKELLEVYRKLGYAKEEIKRLQEVINQRR